MASEEHDLNVGDAAEVDENSTVSDNCGMPLDDVDEDNRKEAEERQRLYEIEQNVLVDPRGSLHPHTLLVNGYALLGDIEKCREARERMVEHFGVGPVLWKDWIELESSLATSYEEKLALCDFYERALKEYLSVDLWLSYVQFYIGFLGHQGLDAVRSVFERALAACGLHVRKGSLIWDAYREYEQAILTAMADTAPESEDAKKSYETQRKRVDSLFRRQLTVPLEFMHETYSEYVQWIKRVSGETAEVDVTVERLYKKALEKLESIIKYEQDFALMGTQLQTDIKLFDAYHEYLDHEIDPARKLCLFERTVSVLWWGETLWLKYISYVDENIKDGSIILPLCERAVRNCHINSRVWVTYIRKLEKFNEPRKVITAVVEHSWFSHFPDATAHRDIWMAFLEYLRRSVKWGEAEEENQLEELRVAYNKASEHLVQWIGTDADPQCELLRSWARMEAIHSTDRGAMRRLWKDILSQGRECYSTFWLEYINVEKYYGDTKHLRKLFPRALSSTVDHPERIGRAWLNFEKDEGTLETVEHCEKMVDEHMIAFSRMKDLKYESSGITKRKKTEHREPSRWGGLASKSVVVKKGQSQKIVEPGTGETFTETKMENGEQSSVKMGASLDKPENLFKKKESGNVHGVTIQHDSTKDDRTVFISNLDYCVNEDSIKEKLSSFGTITDLRLVKDFKGRSKGYCYVEFSNSAEAEAALQKDREPMGNRPMYVSKCDPNKMSRQPLFKYSCDLEKNKLFVRGLPPTTTREDLEKLYSSFGDLKDVRIVTYRNGHSKGLAYVDFKDEVAAAHALIKTDGMKLKDRVISVAISKPPQRKTTSSIGHVSMTGKSLGGGAKVQGWRGRSRTQMFVPRAVLRSTASETASTSSVPDGIASTDLQTRLDSTTVKSNNDFRRMLLSNKQ